MRQFALGVLMRSDAGAEDRSGCDGPSKFTHKIWFIAIGACALVLTACVTPYGPKGSMGGYTDFPVGNGEVAITVEGNGYTDRTTLMQYFHRRAKEICGHDYTFRTEVDSTTSLAGHGNHISTVSRHSVAGYVKCASQAPEAVTIRNDADPVAAPASSRVIRKDGQTCLQGLDDDGEVVEEQCQIGEDI